MRRKMTGLAVAAAALGTVMTAGTMIAQDSAHLRGQMALNRKVIETERQAIVTEAMHLTEAEARGFWSLYREYRAAMDTVHDRSEDLLFDFARSFDSMTDEKAGALIEEMLRIQGQELKVKERYWKKFSRLLPEKKAARFFHLDNKLDAIVKSEAAQDVPLVE